MKKFRDLVNESPVGKVGRTGYKDAEEHIIANNLEKEFSKIVQKIGGKTVARSLMARMNQKGEYVSARLSEATNSLVDYLVDSGYKIKKVEPSNKSYLITFYKKIAQEAKEDLILASLNDDFNIELINDNILQVTPL